MSDPNFHSAIELAARVARREISSRELLDVFLARVERRNPALNAVVTFDVERAREHAAAADEDLAHGRIRGPLHGLPMTIKETFEIAGVRTTAGAKDLSDHVPTTDAAVVQRLRAAGAVIFGKTNVPFMAADVQSYNELFGQTNNPWDPARTPGGSSGGSAAALAAGLTPIEFGSDIGGSIRTPANWCGVYGHKPTFGIVPRRGHIPGPPGTLSEADLSVAGPMARSAEDLDLLLRLTAGPLEDRAIAWRLDLPPPRRASLRDYRVAAWIDDPHCPVDAEVATALRATVDALRRAGVAVDEVARPPIGLRDLERLYFRLLAPVMMAGMPAPVFASFVDRATGLDDHPEDPVERFVKYGTARLRDWYGADEARQRLRAALAGFFREHDVLLCPGAVVPAIPHDHTDPMPARTIEVNGRRRGYYDLFTWIALATTALHPATMAPVGRTAGGLPVGVQIVGPYLDDRTTIDFARRLGELIGGFEEAPEP